MWFGRRYMALFLTIWRGLHKRLLIMFFYEIYDVIDPKYLMHSMIKDYYEPNIFLPTTDVRFSKVLPHHHRADSSYSDDVWGATMIPLVPSRLQPIQLTNPSWHYFHPSTLDYIDLHLKPQNAFCLLRIKPTYELNIFFTHD